MCKVKGNRRLNSSLMRSLLFTPFFLSLIPSFALSQNSSCPLDFSVLDKFIAAALASSPSPIPLDTPSRCSYALQNLHLVQSQYLLTTSRFVPPAASAAACWSSFQSALSPLFNSTAFDVRVDCGFPVPWIAQGCMNITTRQEFEDRILPSAVAEMSRDCNRSLQATPACTACTRTVATVQSAYLPGPNKGNVSDCISYVNIYVGAEVNRFGPTDNGTANCLLLLISTPTFAAGGGGGSSHAWVYGAAAGGFALLVVAALGALFLVSWHRERWRRQRRREARAEAKPAQAPAMDALEGSTTLIKFSYDEIKAATKNFSRENIIGRGGYGNVYRGVLLDGTHVAFKRFKNCSVSGDASFAHEVEVIASVRHVNLLSLRGYCIATTQMEGHQRIIVCDLMPNGSLHDHLFGSPEHSLTWPMRHKIAVGTARGLAYLHDGVQPAIIHRDIKANNILLDDKFEAKVADFGLAKFAPEGVTHVSTRVAGTLGYVAPEYALYGQLTEKSDVYSFGVLLLELLSGKKALVHMGEGQIFLVTDWAWSLVRKGKALNVIEEGMEDLCLPEVLEKYVHVAVLCTHPQLHARPTMDQIVKILETDVSVPTIPDHAIPIVSNIEDIERSASSSGSGQLFNFTGYQSYTLGLEDGPSMGSPSAPS